MIVIIIIIIIVIIIIIITVIIIIRYTWHSPARVENHKRVSETSSVGNNASNVNLSNSLLFLNTTNCNFDKRNNDFDPH